MPAFNADDYTRRLGTIGTPEGIDKLFNEIAKLPEDNARAALISIERAIVHDWQSSAPTADELAQLREVVDVVDDLKGTDEGQAIRDKMDSVMGGHTEATRTLSRIFANVAEQRGDNAHPLVKLYVQEEARIPLDEIDSGFGQAKLMVAVEERVQSLVARPSSKPAPKKGGSSFDL
ncbi:MAG: hypothetical protein PSY14_09580 [bacterium]|nr:hypothetical protein [bacterium]